MLHLLELKLENHELYKTNLKDPHSLDSVSEVNHEVKWLGQEAIRLGTELLSRLDTSNPYLPVTGGNQVYLMRHNFERFVEKAQQLIYLEKQPDLEVVLREKAVRLIPILEKIAREEYEYFKKHMADGSFGKPDERGNAMSKERVKEVIEYGAFLKSLTETSRQPGQSAEDYYTDLHSRYQFTKTQFFTGSLHRHPLEEWYIAVIPTDV